MRRSIALAGLCLTLNSVASGQTNPNLFPDTPENHWVYETFADLKSQGILVGYPDGLGYHIDHRNRYEMAVETNAALIRLHELASSLVHGNDSLAQGLSPWRDETLAEAEKEMKSEIIRMRSGVKRVRNDVLRIVSIFEKELSALGVDVPSMRKQFRQDYAALIWMRPAKAGEARQSFRDVPSTHWASDATRQLRVAGILRGDPDGKFGG